MKIFSILSVMAAVASSSVFADVNCNEPPTIRACSYVSDRGPEDPKCVEENEATLSAHIEKCGQTTMIAYPNPEKKEVCSEFFRVTMPSSPAKEGTISVGKETATNPGSRGLCYFSEKVETLRTYNIVDSELDKDCLVLKFSGQSEDKGSIQVTHIIDSRKMFRDNGTGCSERYNDVIKATGSLGGSLVVEKNARGQSTVHAKKYNSVNLYSRKFYGVKLQGFDTDAKAVTCDQNAGWPFKRGIQAIATEFGERCRNAGGALRYCQPAGTKYPPRSAAEEVNAMPVCSVSAPKP